MEDKDLIALIEKATGEALNEEKIKGLIDAGLAPYLKALDKKDVGTGDDLADKGTKIVTLSQFLGDVRRMGMNEGPAHVEKSLYTTTTAGGYLVPTEESRELLDLMTTKWSVIPGLCRRVPMATKTITFPTATGGVTVYWVPETTADKDQTNPADFTQSGGFKPPSSPTFGQKSLTAHTAAVKVVVSNQLLDDSDPSVSAFLMSLFAEALGEALDIACLRGTAAATDPISGLDALITTNILAAGADFTFDDILDLIGAVQDSYNSPLGVDILGNLKAERTMMKLKDGDGQYIYKPPTQAAGVPTIWGEPFRRDANIVSTYGASANETRLYAGRFAQDALLGIRQGVTIKTNPWAEPYFSHNQTAFLAEFRQGFTLTTEARFAMLTGVPIL